MVGVILNLAIWFALHTWFGRVREMRAGWLSFDMPDPASVDGWAVGLSLAAMVAIFRFNAGLIQTLAASAAAGLALRLLGAV